MKSFSDVAAAVDQAPAQVLQIRPSFVFSESLFRFIIFADLNRYSNTPDRWLQHKLPAASRSKIVAEEYTENHHNKHASGIVIIPA